MSLITLGSHLLQARYAQEVSSLSVKSVYSVDFGKIQDVYVEIARKEDPCASKFKEALKGESLQRHHKTLVFMRNIAQQLGGPNPFGPHQDGIIFRIEAQFDCFSQMQEKGDPYKVKEAVDVVLGIGSTFEMSSADKQTYFDLLTRVGFLKTPFSSPFCVRYNPGTAAQKILQTDPSITRLILGCGRNVNYHPSCGFEQHENALFIDQSSHIAPDVLTDMHRVNFWKKIPTARFIAVLDHTNGSFVFGQARTIKEIYRVLAMGGSFSLAHPFTDEFPPEDAPLYQQLDSALSPHFPRQTIMLVASYVWTGTADRREMLTKAGFSVESDDQTLFRKG